MESSAAMRPSAVAFSTSFLVTVEQTQLVAEDLAIALLVARCFTRIQHKSVLGGSAREEEAGEISNGGGGGHELVNSTIPHYASYIYLLGEGSWAETWRKDRKWQPTNGKKSCGPFNGHKIVEVTVLPIKRFALMKSYVIIDAINAIYTKVKGWRRQIQSF
jgi:hypothetical protein